MFRYAIIAAIALANGCGDSQVQFSTPSPADDSRPATIDAPVAPPIAADVEWGSLTGRFVWDGALPKLDSINPDRDREVCGNSLVDDSIVVNADDKGIANVFVWLRSADFPIHPDFDDTVPSKVRIHARGCRFVPHAFTIRVGQTLDVSYDDPVFHNVWLDTEPRYKGVPRLLFIHEVQRPEPRPVTLNCSVHPWMRAWALIQDHPYMAVTDENGHFSIAKLPAGVW